jgi:apolipoprotein N-acyltransferase
VACFHLALVLPVSVLFLIGAIAALRWATAGLGVKSAFLVGSVIAIGWYAPHLWWFTNIFASAAVPLWCLLALWVGQWSAVVATFARRGLPWWGLVLLGGFLWAGLEHIRCEVWPLRFTWLGLGWTASPHQLLPWVGVYGSSCLIVMGGGILFETLRRHRRLRATAGIGLLLLVGSLLADLPIPAASTSPQGGPRMVGLQVESQGRQAVRALMERALTKHGPADIFVLPEYTFPAGVPDWLPEMAVRHQTYIICGVIERRKGLSYNTAVVIDPTGADVFRQVKSQPIQFFNDGEPATHRALWHSPWGLISIVICYDLSYTWVIDDVVRQGAEMLIAPTMDAAHWGAYQHRLHGRVAPLRAVEYQLPIFRIASSGISQTVNQHGQVLDSAPFPGQGEVIVATMPFHRATVPPLRWLWNWAFVGLLPLMMMVVWRSNRPKKANDM